MREEFSPIRESLPKIVFDKKILQNCQNQGFECKLSSPIVRFDGFGDFLVHNLDDF